MLPGHEFLFVGGCKVSDLEQEGYRVVAVPVLGTAIGKSRVRVTGTIAGTLRILPRLSTVIKRLAVLIDTFRPDLILSDYEFFTPRAARMSGMSCVSLDNQHMLTHCRVLPPSGHRISRWMTTGVMRLLYGSSSRYLVTCFHSLEPKDPRKTEVLPPVIRKAVRETPSSTGEHALVYLRGGLPEGLMTAFRKMNRPFVIYGSTKRTMTVGNLTFKIHSDREFVRDLASSAYVVCNGGHSTISEALYHGKPVLCHPVRFFYEQAVNGQLLSMAGYGEMFSPGDQWEANLRAFEADLGRYRARIRGGKFLGNEIVAERLRELISFHVHKSRRFRATALHKTSS